MSHEPCGPADRSLDYQISVRPVRGFHETLGALQFLRLPQSLIYLVGLKMRGSNNQGLLVLGV